MLGLVLSYNWNWNTIFVDPSIFDYVMRFGCWACLADFQSTTLVIVGGKVIMLITFLFLVNDLCLASSIEILMDNPHRVSKNFCLPP